MKKRLVMATMLTTALVAGMISGCGKKETAPAAEKGTAAQTTEKAAETKAEAKEDAKADAKEESKAEPESTKAQIKGTPYTADFFKLTYPDGWTIKKETQEKDKSKLEISLMEGEKSLADLTVLVYAQDAEEYRDTLDFREIDAYEMVENHSYETKKAGGFELTKAPKSFYYIGRDEGSGMSLVLEGNSAAAKEPRVDELISTIEYTLPKDGKVDPPWPWNGERIKIDKEHTVTVGDKTIRSEYLEMEEPLTGSKGLQERIDVTGDSVWILSAGRLFEYSMGDTLKQLRRVELPNTRYDELSSDADGNLYLTGSMQPVLTLKDGEIIAKNNVNGFERVIMDKYGTPGAGLDYEEHKLLQKVTMTDNQISVSELPIIDVEKISRVGFTKKYMFVSGKNPETNNQAIWLFDRDGNEKLKVGDQTYIQEPGGLANIKDIVETDAGFCVLDGNARRLAFWKPDGTFIGVAENEDIFGTKNLPAISSATVMDDGSILICLTEARDDGSGKELLVYRLTGF